MSLSYALPLVAATALLALALGIAIGMRWVPRLNERRERRTAEQSGLTVSEMFAHIVSMSPLGMAVVDTYRDVVYTNSLARDLGLVRDRLLDDRAWEAAQRTLATGEDVEFDACDLRTISKRKKRSKAIESYCEDVLPG